jgi:tRNA(Ile)-lysidine synthase
VLVERVRSFWQQLGPPPAGGVVVAVSGGPDSVALLRALTTLRAEGACGPLAVAHLNHTLRGGESDADADFVRGLCEHLRSTEIPDLEWCCTRADVALRARQQGDNL